MVKSQILAGGRGLGKFKSGLQGGVHICSIDEAPKLAEQMLGQVGVYPTSLSVNSLPCMGPPCMVCNCNDTMDISKFIGMMPEILDMQACHAA